jgi:hypothetical protein
MSYPINFDKGPNKNWVIKYQRPPAYAINSKYFKRDFESISSYGMFSSLRISFSKYYYEENLVAPTGFSKGGGAYPTGSSITGGEATTSSSVSLVSILKPFSSTSSPHSFQLSKPSYSVSAKYTVSYEP